MNEVPVDPGQEEIYVTDPAAVERDRRDIKAREATLRKMITQFIKNHIAEQEALVGLDTNSQYRQLSWALGPDGGKALLSAFPATNKIAKHKTEVSALTHYIRAFIAAKLNIKLKRPIKYFDATSIVMICEIGDDNDQITDARLRLWRKMVEMIPEDMGKKRGSSVMDILLRRLDSIESMLKELLDSVGHGR